MEEDPKGKKEKNRRGDSEKELHSNRLTDLGLVSKQLQLRDTEQERSDQLINKETHSKKVCAEIKGQGATAVHASKLRPNAATPVKNDGEIDSTMGLGDKTSFKTKSVQADLRVKLVSELRLACSADLEILFSFINRSMPLEEKDKQAVKTSLKALESEKISHFHSSLTNFSFGLVNLESLLELLLDLTKTDNAILLHASLRVLHVLLEHVSFRDNITDEEAQPSLDTLFKWMNHIASERTERDVKLEAVSIMNIIVMRTDAYTEREI